MLNDETGNTVQLRMTYPFEAWDHKHILSALARSYRQPLRSERAVVTLEMNFDYDHERSDWTALPICIQ